MKNTSLCFVTQGRVVVVESKYNRYRNRVITDLSQWSREVESKSQENVYGRVFEITENMRLEHSLR